MKPKEYQKNTISTQIQGKKKTISETKKMLLNNIGAAFCYINLPRPDPKHQTRIISSRFYCRRDPPSSPAKVHWKKKNVKPQSICTADELHHITVPNSNWKLALWRYLPSPKVHKVLNFMVSLNTLFTMQ
jgi:hypothetical protein